MSLNVGNNYVNSAKKNITKYMKLMLGSNFDKNVFDYLLEVYIDVRYYNYYEIKYKNFETNINYYMKDKAKKLMEDDKISDKVKSTFYLFKYILYFDDVLDYDNIKDIVREISNYRINTLGIIDTDYEDDLISLVRENTKKKREYLNSFYTSKFEIILNKTNQRNIFYSNISYNIKFPKIYSEYSLNKVFNTGIVNENKYFIKYYLLSSIILNNVIFGDFSKKYITDFCISLFDKEEKFNRFLDIINSDCIKENIIISFSYDDYLKYKDKINELISLGYKMAVEIDSNFDLSDINKKRLEIFNYIITSEVMYKNVFDVDRLIVIDK